MSLEMRDAACVWLCGARVLELGRRSRVCLFRHKQHVVDQEELPAPLSGFDVAVRRFISNLYTHPTHVYTIYSPPGAPRVLACALAFPPLLRSSLLAFRAPGVWNPLSWLLVLYFNFK